MIIDYKKNIYIIIYISRVFILENSYHFETSNCIYRPKKLLEIKHVDQIKELEEYLKSDSFKEFLVMEREHEKQEMEL